MVMLQAYEERSRSDANADCEGGRHSSEDYIDL